MLGSGENAQLLRRRTRQLVVRHHALDSFFNNTLRVQFQRTTQGECLQTTRVAGVAVTEFTFTLVAGNSNLIGVDDDDMVTTINVGGILWLAFAAQKIGGDHSKTTQNHVSGVNDVPLAGNFTAFRVIGRQNDSL